MTTPTQPTHGIDDEQTVEAVDLRDLPPPEPMVAVMDALDAPLPACGYWAFLLPRFPEPLVTRIEAMGLAFRAEPAPDYRGVLMLIMPGGDQG